MKEVVAELLRASVDMVPHWYRSKAAPYEGKITYVLGDPNSPESQSSAVEEGFGILRPLEGDDGGLLNLIRKEIGRTIEGRNTDEPLLRSEVEMFKQRVALRWLEAHHPGVAWGELLSYADFLRYRTYENDPVVFNALLTTADDADPGIPLSVTRPDSGQKILDPIATSPHSYLRLDRSTLRLLAYEEVDASDGYGRGDHIGCPEFAAIIGGQLDVGEFSFHRTRRGDVLILSSDGMLATWRKGSWYLYHLESLEATLAHALNKDEDDDRERRAVRQILDVVFDLSYKRHGALLIYYEGDDLEDYVEDETSVFENAAEGKPSRRMLAETLRKVEVGKEGSVRSHKKRLAEAASIDGAVVYRLDGIRGCGIVVKDPKDRGFPEGVKPGAGARTRATYLARRFGGIPIKVSSDGDVLVLFKDRGTDGKTDDYAKLTFA